jgi:murein endopeptidase
VLVVSAALFVAACASVATQMSVEETDPTVQSGDLRVERAPQPPPFVPPPEPAGEFWAMPDVEQQQPAFPFLPGESQEASRSVADVTHGWLINAKRIPQPHPHLQTLSVQYTRGLNYTSDQMLALLESAGAHVAKEFPGTVLHLGNFSAQGGGDIPYSVSHNSGRDGDLGFFVVDEAGDPVAPPDLLPLDENGRYEGEEGTFVFDAPRNWALVEGMIESDAAQLQYIFISEPLKRMLLDAAREQGASSDTIKKAKVLLHQPGGALPHNDHFHIRIYCSDIDVASGCRDYGRKLSGYESHWRSKRKATQAALVALGATDASVRLAAVRRLALLKARKHAGKIAARLDDDNPRVRAAAARVLSQLGRGDKAIAERLAKEEDAQALVEMIGALGELGGRTAMDALAAQLESPRPIELPGALETDARAFVAEALVHTESAEPVPHLIAALQSDHADVRVSAARALRILTNHRHADDAEFRDDARAAEAATRWQTWYEENGDKGRDDWLACGFKDAGYEVERLSVKHVWDLCRAVADADYLSYNAQRVLMRISGREPASLSWPKHDANFYWRRWFERRWRRFGAPPIPQELSTLR